MTALSPEVVRIGLGNVGMGAVDITWSGISTTWDTILANPVAFAEVVRQFVEDHTEHTPTVASVSLLGKYQDDLDLTP